jgi:hypothetical protein
MEFVDDRSGKGKNLIFEKLVNFCYNLLNFEK